jgi:hypothetical protein
MNRRFRVQVSQIHPFTNTQEMNMPAAIKIPSPNGQLAISPEEYQSYREQRKRLRAEGVMFPLLPRHGIYLFAPHGGGERFAQLFVETWRRLPLRVRRRVLKHWSTDPFPYQLFKPSIELLAGWSSRDRGRGLRGTWGCSSHHGHTVRFWTRIVAAFPDHLVQDLIAHELAHVDQWAAGWDLNEMDPFEVEEAADWMVENWGFSATAMDEWAREQGVTKPINLDSLSKSALRRLEGRARRAGR